MMISFAPLHQRYWRLIGTPLTQKETAIGKPHSATSRGARASRHSESRPEPTDAALIIVVQKNGPEFDTDL
jgi:hypothetical protein